MDINPLNVLKTWKPGETRDVPERLLKQARLDGKFDSYSQVYEIEGYRWKAREKMHLASVPSHLILYNGAPCRGSRLP